VGDAIEEGGIRRPAVPVAPRELAYAGLFGAAAIVLPSIFHLVQLGHLFMPMYLPLMALPFFVRWGMAGLTALVVPMLSAVITGMPPLMPPVAPVMAAELCFMAASLAVVRHRWPSASPALLLAPVLVAGRFLNAGLMYAAARQLDLPERVAAGISFVAGWPGLILMMVVIPPIAFLARRLHVR
jgi:hypothetical protein